MKASVSVVIFATLVTLTLVDLALAKKRDRGCRYERRPWSECVDQKMTRTLPLKPNQDAECPPEKNQEKQCGAKKNKNTCKYLRSDWSDCDDVTGLMTMIKTLKPGSPDTCPPTSTKNRLCGGRRAERLQNRRERRLRNKSYTCKYDTADWSECDDVLDTRVATLTLSKGDPEVCEETKYLTKPCVEEVVADCYDRTVSECVEGIKTITFTVKEGADPTACTARDPVQKVCGENKRANKAARKAKKQQRQERRQARRQGGD